MRQKSRVLTLLGIFVTLWFTIVVLNSFLTGTNACLLATALEPGRAQFPLWCLEFWLYRYQGFFGACATIGAGALAYIAVQKQIAVGLIEGRRREMMHINAMLANMRWVSELTDLLDPRNALSVRAILKGEDVAIRESIKARRETFLTGRQQLIMGMDLFLAMSDLSVAATMADSAIMTMQISLIGRRQPEQSMLDPGSEALIRGAMRDEEKHIKSLNEAADKVRELLRARSSKLETVIKALDPV